MKISQETQMILENFSKINGKLKVEAGSMLRTISVSKDVYAVAKVKEVFPVDCMFYDLNALLGCFKLFDECDVTFFDKYVAISSTTNMGLKYLYDNPDVVKIDLPPKTENGEIVLPTRSEEPICSFPLLQDEFNKLTRAAGILDVKNFCINMTSTGNVQVSVKNIDNMSSDQSSKQMTVEIDVSEKYSDVDFDSWCVNAKISSLKIIKADYIVSVYENALQFELIHPEEDDKVDYPELTYWIAVSCDSNFSDDLGDDFESELEDM